jgi:hypothetical protein
MSVVVNRIIEESNEVIALHKKIIAVVSFMEKKTIYKISYKTPWTGEIHSFIGEVKAFNKLSLRCNFLAAEALKEYDQQEAEKAEAAGKQYANTVDYENILSWKEWDVKEAPLIVNYNFISTKMKRQCFDS